MARTPPRYVGPAPTTSRDVVGSPYSGSFVDREPLKSSYYGGKHHTHGWFRDKWASSYRAARRAGLVPKRATINKIASFVGGATIGFASGGVTSKWYWNAAFELAAAGIGRSLAGRSGATGWFGVGLGLGAGASMFYSSAQTLAQLRDAALDLAEGLPHAVWDPSGSRYGGIPDPFHSNLHGDQGALFNRSGW